MTDDAQLIVRDAAAWRRWLAATEDTSTGLRLVLAKKGKTEPTSLTYAEGLEEALSSGWVDGRRHAVDAVTFQQHSRPAGHARFGRSATSRSSRGSARQVGCGRAASLRSTAPERMVAGRGRT